MKAVFISEFDGSEGLEIRDVPDPDAPGEGELLIKVRAAALNRADILQRRGLYPPPEGFPERIPGLEFSGLVESRGPGASRFGIGDRVFGIIPGGAQAEIVTVNENQVSSVPDGMEMTDAAAVPEAFITAHDALFTQADLKKGETVLIHAVGSGVGLAALQLAKAAGAFTVGTSRTTAKLDRCREMGLDQAISAEEFNDFSEVVRSTTDGRGADVILDLVGAKYLSQNLKSLALNGRLMLVGLVGGASAELDMRMALQKRAKIIGTVLRGRTEVEKAEVTAAFEKDVLPLLKSGEVSPNVDRVFPMSEVREAHDYLESNESFGKVVLEIGAS